MAKKNKHRKRKMSAAEKVAWITAAGAILTAFVTGVFQVMVAGMRPGAGL